MSADEPPAIVLVAYGSLDFEARKTYEKIRAVYRREFEAPAVKIAFTAGFIRRRLAGTEGTAVESPLMALAELHDAGHEDIVVQSLHVAPGSEFHEAAALVSALGTVRGKFGFRRLAMGLPLLAAATDYDAVCEALAPEFDRITVGGEAAALKRNPEETAVVLVGHGTAHPADAAYSRMARVLKRDHRNVFLGTIDGFPGLEEALEEVRAAGVPRVRLLPFLLVAGGHASKDIAGDGSGSWKRSFEEAGYEVDLNLLGMGENPRVVEVFLAHTRRAAEGLLRGE
ncbi:sirohydrochlorin cobaltochelatase [Methanotrichaceae archaeon M04Ac]|uniref:Sirohydrochlorin cobaltochelatase n=1 Tax=Candidatus Methanocrinis alkalitolerans TaxID=3033395 RepID=A0ABT5XGC2_9EURY|nr:sirohydrochlorin cobaltochelatase [Candidatus Methanocrinis alkalitolerans]MDF0593776.1 sirohydrochlorin cobaltochelatase [Candidatus Methanocrinis alkalitolerans]